ncbi:DUF3718 domain-containing protein [Shewanella kaireitica]|uniref:DUF3718 domain-containing protein n=1 Tax=Shewanella kaireitica TaxID=212021 RepID=UPI00200DB1F1|nr:DUF3718 domain-containing protein [Shewanella kaireitica]MCL1092463.1 DUF3718 domain-containing protein [Shewanella kaireitica]
MKKGIAIIGLGLSIFTFGASAAISPTMEKSLIAVCKAATKNNLIQFNRTLKAYRINKKLIFPKLVCNGQTFHDFALAQGANKVAKKIANYTTDVELNQAIAMNKLDDNYYSVTF